MRHLRARGRHKCKSRWVQYLSGGNENISSFEKKPMLISTYVAFCISKDFTVSRKNPLRFQTRTSSTGHTQRHTLIDRFTQSSVLLAGLYESYLSASSFSTATIKKSLGHVAALLTWDAQLGSLANERLMRGQPLTEPQIRQFKRWLETRAKGNNQSIAATQQESVNEIMRGAAAFEDWCLRYALTRHGHHSRLIDVRTVQQEFWKDAQGNVPHQEGVS